VSEKDGRREHVDARAEQGEEGRRGVGRGGVGRGEWQASARTAKLQVARRGVGAAGVGGGAGPTAC